jgi:hypothetical protein
LVVNLDQSINANNSNFISNISETNKNKEKQTVKLFNCSVCNLNLKTPEELTKHVSGKKHAKKLALATKSKQNGNFKILKFLFI